MKTLLHTPVEEYDFAGHRFFVKREDLCTQPPGPPFSKIRGLMKRLQALKDQGIKFVGYVETSVSMAGWGVAWGCKQLGLMAVIYNPIYKEPLPLLRFHRERWDEAEAIVIPIKAGMAKVNWNICRNTHEEKYGKLGVVLPLGLPFSEAIEETAREAAHTQKEIDFKTAVVNIGSGTIAAGLMRGLTGKTIYGIMGRTGDVEKKKKTLMSKSQKQIGGMLGMDMRVVDPGWEYTEACYLDLPFLSHPYYDVKAVAWMLDNFDKLKKPVLFWNIGSMPEGYYAKVRNLWRVQDIVDRKSLSKTRDLHPGLQEIIPRISLDGKVHG